MASEGRRPLPPFLDSLVLIGQASESGRRLDGLKTRANIRSRL